MAPDVMARAFEPFFTTKAAGHGTGLGLSMVYGFVKQSGGHVAIDSAPGRGTTVRLYLPRHAGSAGSAGTAAERPAQTLPTGSETILVVEDNDQMRRTAVAQLRALGYTIMEAGNGAEASAILQGGARPDLVFTDIVMPGHPDGYELARLVGQRYPAIRVVMTSGYPGEARGGNGVPLLGKPYRREELARMIRTTLDAPAARA
jgi:CheY-like chemotaxis protein